MPFTDRDMREQVSRALGADAPDFHVEAIVDSLQQRFGTIDIDRIDSALFWEVVHRHAR